jgi:hypothetical protein
MIVLCCCLLVVLVKCLLPSYLHGVMTDVLSDRYWRSLDQIGDVCLPLSPDCLTRPLDELFVRVDRGDRDHYRRSQADN